MCMCVKYVQDTETQYVMGGFENGEVLCWDITNPSEEVSRIKLFSEPGAVAVMQGSNWEYTKVYKVHVYLVPVL